MDQLRAIQTFVAVAEAGTLSAAARALSLSPPSVTRLVSDLEAHLGTALLHRTTRAVTLTEAGLAYLHDARNILAAVHSADDAARGAHERPQGTLRVTASVLFGQHYILPIIEEYLATYPDVSVEALFVDRVVSLVDEGIDIAVRIGALADSSLIAARVGQIRWAVCGSQDYIERRGIAQRPEDLTKHDVIGYGTHAPKRWNFSNGRSVTVEPRLSLSTVSGTIEAAKRGMGLTRVLSYQIGPELESGGLHTVLSEYENEPVPIHLVHAEGPLGSAKVRTFKELAAKRLRGDAFLN
ncbi:LysR family transcriptional regulator [Erythrobacter ani]|uniref:LysR family transcriptional regulator n=1 Tax=Erythrobacter ani TaxID=2827235 RepID=A0ABS6SP48_9SPHN|nr:LysR family transcriptional regulator [Erythrobacter ani]MBV7266267.1 LysR family transcriptional regulator [Erythrobacter ani]